MKKRQKQKLVILSIVLFALFNAPVLLLFNSEKPVFGMPKIYVYIFSVWLASAFVSFFIFKNSDE